MKPWEKFLQVHGINDYAMMDGLRSYHNWLQSKGMIRESTTEVDPDSRTITVTDAGDARPTLNAHEQQALITLFECVDELMAVNPGNFDKARKCLHGMLVQAKIASPEYQGRPHTPLADDIAPAPTVEMIVEAYNGAKATPGGGPVCYLLRSLYPSAFKE